MKSLLAAAIAALCSCGAWSTTLATAPQSSLWLEDPTNPNAAVLYTASGDYTVPSPKWHVAQWGIPAGSRLTGSLTVPPNTDWNNSNPYASVAYTAASHMYQLGANGALAQPLCVDPKTGSINEFDLLLEPNNANDEPGYAAGIAPSATLDKLSSVKLNFGFRLTYQNITAKCTTHDNYGSYLVTLVLRDPGAMAGSGGETLFYQFIILDSRGGTRGPGLYRAWYTNSTGPNFGIDSSIAHWGMPLPTNGGARQFYSFDVYSELKSLIQSGYGALDKDISHWNITGFYMGDLILGGATATTQWDSFTLTTAP